MTRVCTFVPPHLLRRLAESGHQVAGPCAETLQVDQEMRAARATQHLAEGLGRVPTVTLPSRQAWTVHDAEQGTRLPGRPVRSAGEPVTGDPAVDEAADGITATLRLFAEAFDRDSFDGRGAETLVTVHYRRGYDNAFWDGAQLVFGDGDGRIFERFTKPVDVLGHEFAHAVIDHSAGLVYADQSGALNESISDVLATCLNQWLAGQSVEQGSWLIGEGLFRPGIAARALRDMAAPGTAYDDPLLGRDPQVGHLDDFVVTREDNGGVHLNSGIPNRAFHLAAMGLGGRVWERAGLVWYAALTGGSVRATSDFAEFAAATVAAAAQVLDEEAAGAVAQAWGQVGVTPAVPQAPAPDSGPQDGVERVRVRRTGGFTGIAATAELDLGGEDPRAGEVRQLIGSVELPRMAGQGAGHPDEFVYTFQVPGADPVSLPEQQLTPSLRRLAELMLGG